MEVLLPPPALGHEEQRSEVLALLVHLLRRVEDRPHDVVPGPPPFPLIRGVHRSGSPWTPPLNEHCDL